MKKSVLIVIFSLGLLLFGCGSAGESPESETLAGNASRIEISDIRNENASEAEIFEIRNETASELLNENLPVTVVKEIHTEVVQGGPYGEISITVPEGWKFKTCPMDSDDLTYGMYGIHFYPDGVKEGFIELAYVDSFGVCGTGLETESITIAGDTANMGTYDYHEYWDFISFGEKHKGVVAQTYLVKDWWGEYGDQVLDILETLSFEPDVKEGGAYIYSTESNIEKLGLFFSLKNITPTGATLVFNQHYTDSPEGELIYGDDFVMEQKVNGNWEEAPIGVEGDYGFHDIAYTIENGDITESELDWEWLYGELAPGEYRIKKSVLDIVENGKNDKYTVCAYFILN